MIRQQVGDLLEVKFEGKFVYLVVLTKIVMFGGNIVFAHHSDGSHKSLEFLHANRKGFNICTDLLLPKREGNVTRLFRYSDTLDFWLTKYTKASHEHRPGIKAREWFIYDIHDLSTLIARRKRLPKKYRQAMDRGVFSFDLVVEKILAGYTPDQNQHL